jgi:hypothetical protein
VTRLGSVLGLIYDYATVGWSSAAALSSHASALFPASQRDRVYSGVKGEAPLVRWEAPWLCFSTASRV